MTPNQQFILALVIAILPTLPALLAWRKSAQNGVDLKDNTAKTMETHTAVNGRMDELLKQAREAAYSAGVAEGLKQAQTTVASAKQAGDIVKAVGEAMQQHDENKPQ